MLAYIYQVVLLSAVLYAYYHFFLRNEKFHIYNRFYLMGILVLSLVVPLVDIPVYFNPQEEKIYESFGVMQTVIVSAPSNTASTSSYANLLTICYILICSFLFIRLAVSIIKLIILKRSNPFYKIDGILFIETNHNQAPFSFFRWLFWKQDISVESPKGQQIFEHEWYHIYHKHSWDIIFSEMVTILFWFNPIFYLIKNEIKSIQEFLADQYAVSHSDITGYAELLLLQAFQIQKHPLVNPFFNNQLKRRITMLTKSKKPAHQYLKKLMILPLLAILVFLFAFTYKISTSNIESDSLKEVQKIDQSKTSYQKNNTPTSFPDDTLYILNGKKIPKDDVKNMLNSSATNVAYVEVVDSKTSLERYGNDGKNGAIVIATKDYLVSENLRYDTDKETYYELDPINIITKTNIDEEKDIPKAFKERVDVFASFPGGNIAWQEFLQKNINNDVATINGARPGVYRVSVKFIIEPDGSLSHFEPMTDAGYGMEQEVINTLKKSPRWNPSLNNKNGGEAKPVRAYRIQTITFEVVNAYKKNKMKTIEVVIYEKEPIFTKTETDASYPGGANAWRDYLSRNLNLSFTKSKNIPAGNYTTIVQFIVDRDGTIRDLKALTKLGYGFEEEAIRVIKKSGKWIPAMQSNKLVAAYRKQPITFQILK